MESGRSREGGAGREEGGRWSAMEGGWWNEGGGERVERGQWTEDEKLGEEGWS